MSLPKLGGQLNERSKPKEFDMELLFAIPEWLVWCAVGIAAALALAVVANTIAAALDLEAN
jgi:hypothetical protein